MPNSKNNFDKYLSKTEQKVLLKLNSHIKIQKYLDELAINFELDGETCFSPRAVIKLKSAHCIEAALFAAACLMWHGKPAYLLDLQANNHDYDHVVCLFKHNGLWGALSKSNHHALRYRDPIYKTVRELVMSYFHEYLNMKGQKTLRSYSKPFTLNRYDDEWIAAEHDLWVIANDLDDSPHVQVLPKGFVPRPADKFEADISNLPEWKQDKGKRPRQ